LNYDELIAIVLN